jgi:hypothetical protein
MANKFLSGINVTGTTTLNTVANAGTDTDKFLVLDASGNVDFRTGDELYADLGIGSLPAGFTSTVKHAVKAGVALTKGQAVYVTSADGTNMIVGKASNVSEATSSKTMGLIETSLSINGIGNVITEGLLTGLDTTGATAAGDPVWLGTDGNLIYGLLNKPYAPAHLVFIGVVTRRNANNGEIFVKVQNGFELKEIHDVDLITTTPINGHILGYNGTLWVNKTIAGWLGYTPQAQLTLTTTGTSGAATLVGATLNIPNYAPDLSNYVTLNTNQNNISGTKSFTSSAGTGFEYGIGILKNNTPSGFLPSTYIQVYCEATANNIVFRDDLSKAKFIFNNSTQTFTFPAATGTIALTSNIPSITGLVPYTGANSTVNLGSNTLIVREMQIWKGLNNDVDSTAIGRESLASTTSSDANTAFGDLSLRMNTTGSYNTAAGCQALMNNTTGSYNTAFGTFSLGGGGIGGFSGASNTAAGYSTGSNITTGSGNTFIGRQAGNDVTTGNYNVILGSYFGTAAMTSNVILADGEGNIRFQWDGTNIKLNGNTVGSNAFTSTAFVPQTRTLTINGTAYDLSADRSWTVTSMVYPGAGIAVSTGTAWGTSLTDNSSNWNTAFGWGNHASAGYVPGARTLTINGTTYDLTANRSWTIEAGGSTASTRTIQKFTSTASQTTFTITGGYTVGMVDVWVNGVKLDNAVDFTASNGTTVVLTDALTANQIVEVYKYGSQFIVNNGLRQKTLFTATAAQTTFTVAYSVGLVDVFYNGSKLDDSEFTATNGTSIVLGTACAVNDKVEVIAFSYNVSGFTGIGGSGTTNYVPKFTASGTIGNSSISEAAETGVFVANSLSVQNPLTVTSYVSADAFIPTNSTVPTNGMYRSAANTLAFATNSTNRLTITSAGNVGIGTTSPNIYSGFTNLQVNGSTYGLVQVSGSSSTLASFYAGAGGANIGTTSNHPFTIFTNDTERIRITSGGNVGIGTSAPTDYSGFTTLHINGKSGNQGGLIRLTAFNDSSSVNIYASDGIKFNTTSAVPYIFLTQDTERMRITSGGSLGLGTSSPFNPGGSGQTSFEMSGISYSTIYFSANSATVRGQIGADNLNAWVEVGARTNHPLLLVTNNTERMRIMGGTYGKILFGNGLTSDFGAGHLCIQADQTLENAIAMRNTSGTNSGNFIIFQNSGGGQAGSITHNTSTSILFIASSDYRYKENILPIENAIDRVLKIKPVTYNWKNSYNEVGEGFIAHELQEVVPLAVSGVKDEMNLDGTIKPQGIDYGKLTPLLVKAIQELKAEIEQLKQK